MARPYLRFDSQDLVLRDYLAVDRTILANERTFLSYMRTALALIAAGVTFIKLFDEVWIAVVGWLFVPCGVAAIVIGVLRYWQMRIVIPREHLKDHKQE